MADAGHRSLVVSGLRTILLRTHVYIEAGRRGRGPKEEKFLQSPEYRGRWIRFSYSAPGRKTETSDENYRKGDLGSS